MELVYLWVEKYKNIENQGFNFSPRFTCNFFPKYEDIELDGRTYKKLKDNCTLEITTNDYTSIFPIHINITAIIGENGAGKSSLLEILSNKYSPVDFQNLFFIFYNKSEQKLTLHGAKYERYSFISENNLPSQNIFEINLVEDFQALDKTKTVYLSNMLNEYDLTLPMFFETKSYSDTINISVTQVLNQMKPIETKYTGINSESHTGFDKIYRSYRIQEIQKALLLIKDKALSVPFELPTSITIRNIDFYTFIENIRTKFNDDSYQTILEIIRKNNDSKTIFKNYLSVNLVIALLLENINQNNPILNELLNIVLDQKMTSDLEYFYNNVKYKLKGHEFQIDDEKVTASYINNFFDLADKILKALENINASEKDTFSLTLDIKMSNFDFLDAYERLIQQSEYFWDISWRGLSSGEEAFLYQFSKLYFLQKGFKDNPQQNLNDTDNIILLIDEGEMALHPNWQKQYINYLVTFLQKNFSQNIHLILTSHSPFLLSDLPKENVIFLEKGKQVYPNIETFGANIHTLLSHGFFMKDGLMGEFAKSKINEVIDYLNGKKSPITDDDEAQRYIRIIGEPIVKRQLQRMLDSKKLDKMKEIDALKNQIESLQNRLENLENKS